MSIEATTYYLAPVKSADTGYVVKHGETKRKENGYLHILPVEL